MWSHKNTACCFFSAETPLPLSREQRPFAHAPSLRRPLNRPSISYVESKTYVESYTHLWASVW